MFWLENVIVVAGAIVLLAAAGVAVNAVVERMWKRCKAGIRSRKTTALRIAPKTLRVDLVALAQRQRTAVPNN